MNVILCGMPGSGKSHFGAMAAQNLNRMFIDTDTLITDKYFKQKHVHTTCREIALHEGDAYFRCLEKEIVNELKGTDHSIIATGGGILCTHENIQQLKNLGWMIYLKVAPDLLLKRMFNKNALPAYIDPTEVAQSFYALLKQRLPLYEQHCHCSVDVASENVLEIINHYACKEK